MNNFIATPRSTNDIRKLANYIRSIFGFNEIGKEFFPIVDFIEKVMPHIDKKFHIEVLKKSEMKDIHGLACPNEHCIKIREDVYDRAYSHEGRDRFTLAHELGHYLMHCGESVRLARLGETKTVPAYRDPEWQANTFAAELLMPIELINAVDEINPFYICDKFGVSFQAATIRINNIKKIYKH